MKKFSKLTAIVLLIVMLTAVLSACVTPNDDNENDAYLTVYNKYVAYAEAQGTEPLSYEQWLATIKGEKGDKGDTGANGKDGVSITDVDVTLTTNSNGEQVWRFTFYFSDGKTTVKDVPYMGGTTTTHTCKHVCGTCGGCTDTTCTNSVCANNRCKGHTTTGNDGKTADTAYTVAEAIAITNKLAADGVSSSKVYVIGYVTSNPKYDSTYGDYSCYIGDNENDTNVFYLYGLVLGEFSSVNKGDLIIVYGYLKNYKGTTPEMTHIGGKDNPVIVDSTASTGGGSGTDAHTHVYESFFTYGKCTVTGCNEIGRNSSNGAFQKAFTYTLTNAQINSYAETYKTFTEELAKTNVDSNTAMDAFNDYVEGLDFVIEQYQTAYVLYDVENTDANYANYTTAATAYNEMLANYYKAFRLVYDCQDETLKADFFENDSDDDINYYLEQADIYGGNSQTQTDIDNVLADYNDILADDASYNSDGSFTTNALSKIQAKYGELVKLNNKLATDAGESNYMDYAYKYVYGREYTPNDVATMRNYVKQYIAPLFTAIHTKLYNDYMEYNIYYNQYYPDLDGDDYDFYYTMLYDSLFMSADDTYFYSAKNAIDLIASYFKYIDANNNATMTAKVEDLFKTGNYFIGETEGAYTYWFDGKNKAILYFNEDYYSNTFTFVHEFGHYYDAMLNNGGCDSMDLAEIHSQGNEMLMLAWLENNLPTGVSADGYNTVKLSQLEDMLGTVLLATAVDEFEQAVYTNKYGNTDDSDNVQSIPTLNYHDLFKMIMDDYGLTDIYDSSYWAYVCFDNAAYYISYAMSALPAVEIYAKAQTNLASAKTAYLSLFDYDTTDTFTSVLEDASLQSPFDEELYTTLQNADLAE